MQFVSDITDGALSPSVGMVNGLCREFSLKSRLEQDNLFKALLDAPVMHVDGTVARVNGSNNNVVVCSNGVATMYFARESEGHAGIKETPVESFGGILIIAKYVRWRRMEAAKDKILKDREKPLWKIAEEVGFDNYDYFLRLFKAQTGISAGSLQKGKIPDT